MQLIITILIAKKRKSERKNFCDIHVYDLYFLQESPRKKKRKKSGQNPSNEENDFVAIGTSAGNILLYNVNKGDLQSQLVCENEFY